MSDGGDMARAIENALISPNELDRNMEPANVVDGLFAIARAVSELARAVDRLGNGNAATDMGALENLAKETHDGFAAVAAAIADRD